MIEFSVPGAAKSERKRQRFVKSKTSAFTGHRTDEPDRRDWKSRVALFAVAAGVTLRSGPLTVELEIRTVKPKSWPKRPTTANRWPEYPWRKPDVENYAKPFLDALTGIAWHDDAQIVKLTVLKSFGEIPEAIIRIADVAAGR